MSGRYDVNTDELWLLARAVEVIVPVNRTLGTNEYLRHQWNCVPHPMTPERVITRLIALTKAGLISLYNGSLELLEAIHGRSETNDVPSSTMKDLSYGLTAEGGEVWEQIVSPQWNLFVDIAVDSDVPFRPRLRVHKLSRLDAALAILKCNFQLQPLPGEQKLQFNQPWNATYWKTLNEGWELALNCSPLPIANCADCDVELLRQIRGLQEWHSQC